jgi:cytochrome c553
MIRICHVVLLCLLALPVGAAPQSAISEPPPWAYPVTPPDSKPTADDGAIRKVPDSSAGYTLSQVRDKFLAPDWHPADHPKMPGIVAHGRKPDVLACGYCHRADGPGGPENASLAALPYAYIVQQMADCKSGRRSTALPNRIPQSWMMALAKAITEEEVREAASYFSSLKPRQNIRVVETDRVPKTYVANWFLAVQEGKETELLGERIVETPENLEQFESRDARATFVAYVPVGSISKGAAIANGEAVDKAPACTTCHGQDLKGRDAVPSIAGRSPSYAVRQLYDIQTGARAGKGSAAMKKAVAKLSLDDMIAVAAYLASLKP